MRFKFFRVVAVPANKTKQSSSALNALFLDNHSLVQKIDPRARIIGTVAFAFAVVLSDKFAPLLIALLCSCCMVALAKLSFKQTLKKMAAMDSFMLYLLVMLPFTTPGDAFFQVQGFNASVQGLERGIQITLKANAVVLMLFASVSIIPSSTLGSALGALKVSPKLIQLLLFTLRYLSVIANEFQRLRRAMKARAFILKFNWHSWQSMGYLIAMMLLRAMQRSQQIIKAMKCRGYQGQFISYYPLNWQARDTLYSFIMVIIISMLASLNLVDGILMDLKQ